MSHLHGWPYDVDGDKPVTPSCIEIGPEACLRESAYQDGTLAGFIEAHAAADMDVRCEGFLTVNLPTHVEPSEVERARPRWTMTGSLAGGDLTLSPSVLCRRDGHHGFVRDGKWVPA